MGTIKIWTLELIDAQEMMAVKYDDTRYSPEGFKEEPHRHEFFELEYVVSGIGVQNINGVDVIVKHGDVIFFNVDDIHSYYSKKNFAVINCIFRPEFRENQMMKKVFNYSSNKSSSLQNIISISGYDRILFEEYIEKITQELKNRSLEYSLAIHGYFQLMLVILFRAVPFETTSRSKKFSAILDYVNLNWKTVTISSLANEFAYNPTYLSTMFSQNTGNCFTDYINRRKILEAAKLLEATDKTVETVLQEVGFKDKKHFYQIFRKYLGVTPGALSKKNN